MLLISAKPCWPAVPGRLIYGIFLLGAAAALNAQVGGTPPVTCFVNVSSTPSVRAEGMTEAIGDITLTCTGGVATASGAAVPSTDIVIFLNTAVTSRLYANGWSEALLLIDEPGSGLSGTTNTQLACSDPNGVCAITGTGTGAGVYNGSPGRPNVFPGRVSGNSVTFTSVPVDPPGSSGATRTFRITNIRADATVLSGGSGAASLVASISVGNPAMLPLQTATPTVGFLQTGLNVSLRPPDSASTSGQCLSAQRAGVLRFREAFGTAFKNRTAVPFVNGDTSPSPLAQAIPGSINENESGFYNPALFAPTANFTTVGLADAGTRLRAVISGIPQGAKVLVSTRNVSFTGGNPAVVSTRSVARLVLNEAGAFGPLAATGTTEGVPSVQLPVSNGSAIAVWEVLANDVTAIENFDFMIWVQTAGAGIVGNVSGSFAPAPPAISAIDGHLASATLPVPRFADFLLPALNLSTSAACAPPTTTVLTSSAQTAPSGSTVVFTASVTSPGVTSTNPTSGALAGTVTFYDGGTAFPGGTVTLSGNGTATFTSKLSDGLHSITAAFTASANIQLSSTSSPVSVFVTPLNGSTQAPPLLQQGGKLVGSGALGLAEQGGSVALSGDGNTLIVGGPFDNSGVGAAWVFTRVNGTWKQQAKLVGSGAASTNNSVQGVAVAVSADGSTAAVGGPMDNAGDGAVWVFTFANGAWSQQGNKIVGSGALGKAEQGSSVALSADGSTMIAGGASDSFLTGAAWIFTRTNGVWAQQGSKLVGTGAVGGASQGASVALSADGSTAIIGGPADSPLGAAWVFTNSTGAWSQQGPKLVGSGAIGQSVAQGTSVALSGDGSTAIVGGENDDSSAGAAWVFTGANGVWTQQTKLVGTGAGSGHANQGHSVAISLDGSTALVGGPFDNGTGAAWLFTQSNGIWSQAEPKLVGSGAAGVAEQGWAVALSGIGDTAIAGALSDAGSAGAVWTFAQPVPSITALSVSGQSGGQITLTATVTSTNITLSGPPAGTVTFYDNGIAIPGSTTSLNALGFAMFASNIDLGNHRVSALFSSSGSLLLPSGSAEVIASGGRGNATVDLSSSKSPSVSGQFVTFTAVVATGTVMPTGTIQFTDGLQPLGTVTLVGGQAVLQTTLTTAGTHSIFAFYGGDVNYSDATARLGQVVIQATPTLGLAVSSAAAEFGQVITFSAQLTGPSLNVDAPSGQLQLFEGLKAVGSASVSTGAATVDLSTLGVGSHQIFGVYSGDPNWYSVKSAPVGVTIRRATTATVLTGSHGGMAATVTAAAGVPTGSVQFMKSGGDAALATTALAEGWTNATFTAGGKIVGVYSGDANFAPSTSAPMLRLSVVNGASLAATGFAPEESATLFGADFPASPKVTVADDGGTPRLAPVTFASAEQINFVIPAGMPDGDATVAVGNLTIPITIGKVAPGLFPAAAQIIRVHPDGTQKLESASAPISFDSDTLYLVLYGTGIRNRSDLTNVTCTINGQSLPVVFAGAQPDTPGLDQVDVPLPASLKGAGKVNVSVTADGQVSNTVTLVFQ